MTTPRPASDRRTGVAGVLSRAVFRRPRTRWPRAAWVVGAVVIAGGWASANVAPAPVSPAPLTPAHTAAQTESDDDAADAPDRTAVADDAAVGPVVDGAPVVDGEEAGHAGGAHDHDHDADRQAPVEFDGEKHAEHSAHGSIVAPLLAAIVVILFGAKIMGDVFERFGIPSVVGELTLGILLGNFVLISGSLFGVERHFLDFLQPPDPDAFAGAYATNVGASLALLAEIGVILLLFEVGLECTVREMLRVGWTSLFVALAGVVAPILLGYTLSRAFFFDDWQEPAFIGATLCATSVGITARVLRDMNRHRQKESQIILGAAVIDDVLGLIVLAVVQGAIAASLVRDKALALPGAVAPDAAADPFWWDVFSIVGLAALFLGGALALGAVQFPRFLFKMACKLRGRGLLVVTALLVCFGFSYIADSIGLATIVGAFAAGLILEQAQYKELGAREDVHELEDAIRPLTALFVPIFFVLMGMRVDLTQFLGAEFWMMALTFTFLAVLGKMICAFACVEKGVNKIAVGIGMVPRGEVGLIFAAVGSTLERWDEDLGMPVSVVNDTTFSAIVFMVIVTTVITPPALKWSMGGGLDDDEVEPADPHDAPPPPDGAVPQPHPDVTHPAPA